MAIYSLTEEVIFPDPSLANDDGLLAIGGDLSDLRLITAYANGIFPWYSEGQPILWWSPNPRMILFPDKFKRHKNLRRTVKSGKFKVRFDYNFDEVINKCGEIDRNDQYGTWITDEMKEAYINLHKKGLCHSVESYCEDQLVGGLYGISLGGAFFGESMFHLMTDASKVALWYLVDQLIAWDFDIIDVQQETNHLRSLGAEVVEREKFLTLLERSLEKKTRQGNWKKFTIQK